MDRKTLLMLPLFILGAALLVVGAWSLFTLKTIIDEGTLKAEKLDYIFSHPPHFQGVCRSVPVVTLTQRVMSESDTQALTVTVSGDDGQTVCSEGITLDAPEFKVSPNTLSQTLTVPSGQKRNLIWILIPQKLGTFSIAVSYNSSDSVQILGITVTDVFGLTIGEAQLFSGAETFFGTFLGPLLALVWISRLWRRGFARGSWTRPGLLKKKRRLPARGANPLRLVYCYAHEDKALRDRLEKHLSPLLRSGHIVDWDESEITPGTVWEDEIMAHLNAAEIILLLVSPGFVASDDCMNRQMPRALERHRAGEAVVVPIILRPVTWENLPFADLRVLPSEVRPVSGSDWPTEDEAFYDVVQGIGQLVSTFLAVKASSNH